MTGGELATDIEAELASARKQIADADAERLTLESALVDALGCLQFYSDVKNHQTIGMVASDGGARARVTLNRIFDRIEAARVQALREPPVKAPPPEDGTHGCDTCEEESR